MQTVDDFGRLGLPALALSVSKVFVDAHLPEEEPERSLQRKVENVAVAVGVAVGIVVGTHAETGHWSPGRLASARTWTMPAYAATEIDADRDKVAAADGKHVCRCVEVQEKVDTQMQKSI